MNNMDNFYEKYKQYDMFPISNLKHIPKISCYNHNYYKGLKRDGAAVEDLILGITDEIMEETEYYHINGSSFVHIGYSAIGDECIRLQEKKLT